MRADIPAAQLARLDTGMRLPDMRAVELLDRATGGAAPADFEHLRHGVFLPA